jgi:hypothetical protein
MNCAWVRRLLPGLADGALCAAEQRGVREHVAVCKACRHELESYGHLGVVLSRVERPAVPADLAARIRLEVARARAAEPWPVRVRSRLALTVQNFLAPMALPATGGAVSALVMFALFAQSMMIGLPLGAVPNDVPINVIRPAEIQFLAPFPIGATDERGREVDGDIIIETVVDAQGQAVSYEILAGPDNRATRRQLDQVVFFSKFRPQRSFGRAESGGRVLLSFREIRVRG